MDNKVILIFLVAVCVDIFLIKIAKSKLVKSMWICFGVFFVTIFGMKLIFKFLDADPNLQGILYVLIAITAASFIAGVG